MQRIFAESSPGILRTHQVLRTHNIFAESADFC